MKIRWILLFLGVLLAFKFLMPANRSVEERRYMLSSFLGWGKDVPAVTLDKEATAPAVVTATASK